MPDSVPNAERAAKLDTATLSDALDKLGVGGQCLGIKPLLNDFQLTGRAFTLLYGPAVDGGTVGDFIDDVQPGSVVVIDNHGRQDATVWGDILTMCAHRRGLAGTVIDGACRDTHLAIQLKYPIFSRSYSMRTGKDRVQLDAINQPIEVGNSRVSPGCLMRGDSDGVIAIPLTLEDEVLGLAEDIQAAEERIRESVMGGQRLDEARRRHRYHQLQQGKK